MPEIRQPNEVTYFPPSQVPSECLHPNGKLLTEEQIVQAKELLNQAPADHDHKKRRKNNPALISTSKHVSRKNLQVPYLQLLDSELRYTLKRINGRDYAVFAILGAGSFGKVKLMQDLDTGEWAALKVQKNNGREFDRSDVKAEYNTLKMMERKLGTTKRNYSTKNDEIIHYYIVMPLGKGITLKEFLENPPQHLQPNDWLLIAYRILEAYKLQIADKNLVHRDIKPENIMIDPLTFEITFIDLGFAKAIGTKNRTRCGTYQYMPPESGLGGTLQTPQDIFSLGRVIQYLLEYIQENPDRQSNRCWVYSDKTRINNHDIDNKLKPFLASMIAFEPSERPNLDQSINFFADIVSELNPNFSNEKKIGFLDLTAYENLTADAQRAKEEELQHMDLVYFIDSKKRDLKEYLGLKKILEKEKNIKIADKVYQNLEHALKSEHIKITQSNYQSILPEATIKNALTDSYRCWLRGNRLSRGAVDFKVDQKTTPLSQLSKAICDWTKENLDVIADISTNLNLVLQEVIGEHFLSFSEAGVTKSLDHYKANLTTIRQLDKECENYISMPEGDKGKQNTVMEIRKALNIQQRTETTTKILENFKTEFEIKRPELEKVRDPVTTNWISQIYKHLHGFAYNTLSFFFKPKGRQLAEKIKEKLSVTAEQKKGMTR